jgi:hypothetical protein
MKTNAVIQIRKPFEKIKILLMSDLHWDNPHCDRALIKKDLEDAKAGGHDVFINGDLFCCMQGKYDGRRSKSEIRPEHNAGNYLDLIVNTAIEWFTPYAHSIRLIGYGNHETSIARHCETDLIERFVSGINAATGSNIQVGGYGGWIKYHFYRENDSKSGGKSYKIKYYHGAGGGGSVTRGSIAFNRMATMVEGADAIWMGHVHESTEITYTMEYLSPKGVVHLRDVLMVRTPSYKEEYQDGSKGWHVERMAPPKPLGARWMELHPRRSKTSDGIDTVNAYTYKTDIY